MKHIMPFNFLLLSLILIIDIAEGQNQVPPGRRRPPFIVVPPDEDKILAQPSENVPVLVEPNSGFDTGFQAQPQLQSSNQPVNSQNFGPFNPHVNQQEIQNLDHNCLSCLCFASTNCQSTDCIVTGPENYFCGPYRISWAYWADAGRPNDVPGDSQAFERCLKTKECSELAINGYMNKYARDCNGDNRIDCADFARIHKAGPHNCDGAWVDKTDFWNSFNTCWNGKNGIDLRLQG